MCNYKAIIHREDGQYWAEFPAFPGCYTSGATLDEVKSNLPKVLRFHIAGLNEADFDASNLAEDAEAFFQEPNASHLRRAIADMDAGRNIVFR